MKWLYRLALVCLLAPAAVQAAGGKAEPRNYVLAPTPAWVENIAIAEQPAGSAREALHMLLQDEQVDLSGDKPVHYRRTRVAVMERAGLEQASSVSLGFNPRFQTLAIHDIAVLRNGRRIDQLRSARIDIAQRERQLESGVYDANLDAIVTLADVRVGDVVELAYSITGENPVFNKKYSNFFAMGARMPIANWRVQIRYPASRQLQHQARGAAVELVEQRHGGLKILRASAANIPALQLEQAIPRWVDVLPLLQVTEYASWAELAGWATQLYGVREELPADLASLADGFKAASASQEEAVQKALAWVQDEIRYYSIAVGENSHRPSPPAQTFSRRYGDCKDKSVLLTALLRRMGVAAQPALVSMQKGRAVGNWLPSPKLFDHVIVQASIGSRSVWLDPTATHQSSSLDKLGLDNFGLALPALASTRELVAVQQAPGGLPGSEVNERFRITRHGEPVLLEVEMRHTGRLAEAVRAQLASDGVQRMVEGVRSDYARFFPSFRLEGEPQLTDDRQANLIILTLRARLASYGHYEMGRVAINDIYPRSFAAWLRLPGLAGRRYPVALPGPSELKHRVEIEFPGKIGQRSPPPFEWRDPRLHLRRHVTMQERKLRVDFQVAILSDHVALPDLASFAEQYRRNLDETFMRYTASLVERDEVQARVASEGRRSGSRERAPDDADDYVDNARFLRTLSDMVIQGGQLGGTALASAYRHRAVGLSQLDRKDEALADVERALALDDSTEARLLKAELQMARGQLQAARATLQTIREPGNDARAAAGKAAYLDLAYAEAVGHFTQAVERAGVEESGNPLVWLALSERAAGGNAQVRVASQRSRLKPGWHQQMLAFVLGESSQAQLLEAAKAESRSRRARLCEAYYLLGELALIKGQRDQAQAWFRSARDTEVTPYEEYVFAGLQLKRLEDQAGR